MRLLVLFFSLSLSFSLSFSFSCSFSFSFSPSLTLPIYSTAFQFIQLPDVHAEADRLRFSKLDLNMSNPTAEDLERRRQLKLSFQAENIKTQIIKAPPIPERTR